MRQLEGSSADLILTQPRAEPRQVRCSRHSRLPLWVGRSSAGAGPGFPRVGSNTHNHTDSHSCSHSTGIRSCRSRGSHSNYCSTVPRRSRHQGGQGQAPDRPPGQLPSRRRDGANRPHANRHPHANRRPGAILRHHARPIRRDRQRPVPPWMPAELRLLPEIPNVYSSLIPPDPFASKRLGQ
jgi:hypothetical protein